MHTCIHAYMHTCINAHMHTCIHAYMHKCTHAYMHTCMHACKYMRGHCIQIHPCPLPPGMQDRCPLIMCSFSGVTYVGTLTAMAGQSFTLQLSGTGLLSTDRIIIIYYGLFASSSTTNTCGTLATNDASVSMPYVAPSGASFNQWTSVTVRRAGGFLV